MDLLVIRHAIAGDRAEWARTGKPDDARPVTDEGRRRMRESARGLRSVVSEIELIATSPFTRAAQTAAIVAGSYDGTPIIEVPALAHGGAPEAVASWIGGRRERILALVGHEPDLGTLVGWLVHGVTQPIVTLKKGGICLLRLEPDAEPGSAELRWLLPPKILRRLGDS